MTESAVCQLESISFHGWSAYRLSNGLITAVVVPELGGRIMSLKLGPYEYLFLNKALAGKRFTFEEHAGDGTIANWKNYGGDKTWPAPQGWDRADQWPGPPDPILDSGQYEAMTFHEGDTVGVTMTSPPDHRHTGLRITRRISLQPNTSALRLALTFENISGRPVRWSIWNLAQLDCSRDDGQAINDQCWLYIPTDPARTEPYSILYGADNPPFLTQLHPAVAPGVMALQYKGQVGKIGIPSPANWLAFANQQAGYALCMRAPYQHSADYPDGGASLESWTESPGAPSPIPLKSPGCILEAEILGPLCILQPGETTSLPIDYTAVYCPGPIIYVTDVACVHEPLHVTARDGWAQVRGVFGCFEAGTVELVWVDSNGNNLSQQPIMPVSPFQPLRVDAVAAVPQPASWLVLQLTAGSGAPRAIAQAAVP